MEVVVTLKMTASELQTLRGELALHRDNVHEQMTELSPGGRKQSLLKREAKITFLLEKLG